MADHVLLPALRLGEQEIGPLYSRDEFIKGY